LIKRAKSLQLIFNTFIITLPALMNVGGLLLFFLYMYSIVGMIAFGAVKMTGLANNQLNFEDFTSSFVTLFVVATGDSWNLIMTTFASEQSSSFDCVNSP